MEKDIKIENGLSVVEIRMLLETTQTLARALSTEEFKAIMGIYYGCTERLLKSDGR